MNTTMLGVIRAVRDGLDNRMLGLPNVQSLQASLSRQCRSAAQDDHTLRKLNHACSSMRSGLGEQMVEPYKLNVC